MVTLTVTFVVHNGGSSVVLKCTSTQRMPHEVLYVFKLETVLGL